MKKLISIILAFAVLASSVPAIAASEKPFPFDRPDDEVAIIESYLKTAEENFTLLEEVDLLAMYFENADTIVFVFTLENESSTSLTEWRLDDLKPALELTMTWFRERTIENFVEMGIDDVYVNVFCNTNDFNRVLEIWDENLKPNE